MRVGVLTAGGDCPGLNAAIRAVARSAMANGDQAVGILAGYRGLAERTYVDLDPRAVSGILALGGTILGTSSYEPHTEGTVGQVRGAFVADRLDAVVAIGGEHTMAVTRRLWEEEGLPVIGVPKTIDNDVVGTDYTIGFDTAVEIAVDAIDRLHTTAQSHNRVMVVEVMGRNSGWIAVHAGLASGADEILVPEREVPVETLARELQARHSRGKDFSIIVVAEGARLCFESGEVREVRASTRRDEYGYPQLGGIGAAVAEEVERLTGFETRVTVLGHVQRGGTPTATDRILATRLGIKAYELACEGEFGRMAAIKGDETRSVPLDDVEGVKTVPLDLLDDIASRFFG